MATTNYNLPTLEATAPFDLVTDYNALSNATDSALAQVAGLIPTETITQMQGQISALQTSVSGNTSNIQTLQGQMTTANDNISSLNNSLTTANNNIGGLQTGLQSTNNNLSALEQEVQQYFTFTNGVYSGTAAFPNNTGTIYTMVNTPQTLIKIWGDIMITTATARVVIPGVTWESGETMYGIRSNFRLITRALTTGYSLTYAGSKLSDSQDSLYQVNIALGSDGYLYYALGSATSSYVDQQRSLLYNIPYFLDTPINAVQESA